MKPHLRARLAQDFWDLISHFFAARKLYLVTYERYETLVLHHAEEQGVDRRVLRLPAEQVAGLLDFRKLEVLRDGEMFALKTVSHNIFRNATSTDPFDRYVSQMFHELSILKEEQYRIATLVPLIQKEGHANEVNAILDEVHQVFPRFVHGIYELFEKAQDRLEELLPRFTDGPQGKVTIRSLYLFGDETFRGSYANGIEDVYELIYEGGAVEGYLAVARSFAESGFREYAIEALEKALRLRPPAVVEAPAPVAVGARADGGNGSPAPPAADGGPASPPGGTVASRAAERRREAEALLRELKETPRRRTAAATPQPARVGA